MTWELVWMLIILKIPVVYLCLVVWWAIRKEPQPLEPAVLTARIDPEPRPGWQPTRSRRPGRGPHGSPTRRDRRKVARAEAPR
jgi:hypothetical protein